MSCFRRIVVLTGIFVFFSCRSIRAQVAWDKADPARGILESVMLNLMYEIPSRTDVRECIITPGVILKGEEPLMVYEHELRARENNSGANSASA